MGSSPSFHRQGNRGAQYVIIRVTQIVNGKGLGGGQEPGLDLQIWKSLHCPELPLLTYQPLILIQDAPSLYWTRPAWKRVRVNYQGFFFFLCNQLAQTSWLRQHHLLSECSVVWGWQRGSLLKISQGWNRGAGWAALLSEGFGKEFTLKLF